MPIAVVWRMSAIVQVFGRRHDETIHTLRRRRPKSAKARSRGKYGTRQCSECYGDLMLAAVSIMGGTPVSCEEKYPRHIQANWFAPFVKTTFVIALWRGRCDSPHQGAGLPDDPCCS